MRRARHATPLLLLAAAVFAAAFGAPDAAAQTPRYTVTDLGPFEPSSVNEMGQVAGSAILDSRSHVAYWDGTFRSINPPGSVSARGGSVNNLGHVNATANFCDIVGDTHQNCRARAFVYRNGAFTILDTLGGRDSWGGDVDDAGVVYGSSSTAGPAPDISGEFQAFVFKGGQFENVGAKMGTKSSHVRATNSVGQIVGNHTINNAGGVFIYDTRDGTFTLFPVTGVSDHLNDLGQIVGGLSGNDDGSGRAFLLSGGVVKDLGTLMPSHRYSRAVSLNNAGQIVGISSSNWFTRGDERAFLYEGGVMLDLNALIPPGSGWVLKEATDINGSGQIVGRGTLNGQERGFLLTPAAPPVLLTEPDSAAALALDSVTFERAPFTLSTAHNFSADGRRRVTLLARNVEFAPGEGPQQLSVRAEGVGGETHLLPVEHVGRVRGFPSLTQITVRLADGMTTGGDFQLSLTLRNAVSNKATLSIGASAP
jgi:probable HAF family extracellular repeat protein